ncbi:conserved hypothetical protein [Ricinus communis]|uniref:Uncharacterized protein n=1 Tax=Ricinus communis TaxID=3988 RepID=B9TGK4_RICCO|nr:conserved hypothetical protein [Ricinus communis]
MEALRHALADLRCRAARARHIGPTLDKTARGGPDQHGTRKRMKPITLAQLCAAAVAAGLSLPTCAAPCSAPDASLLRATWQAFRAATLEGQPDQVIRYYKFPLQLLPPMEGMRPLKISRAAFLKNYAELFQRGPADTEIAMLTAMKKSTGKEFIPTATFDTKRCAYLVPTRIEDYNFVYDKKTGWVVESMYYDANDLNIGREAQLDH